jgi:hypothetical protein
MRRGDGRARPAGGRGLTAAASALWALAAALNVPLHIQNPFAKIWYKVTEEDAEGARHMGV